jgi:enolase
MENPTQKLHTLNEELKKLKKIREREKNPGNVGDYGDNLKWMKKSVDATKQAVEEAIKEKRAEIEKYILDNRMN